MRPELFMYFCIKNYIGTQGEVVDCKNILTPPLHPNTDRSKELVLVFFLFCVTLWFILRGASCFKVFLHFF